MSEKDKVKVTPEMASAGADEVSDYDGKFVTAAEIATRAYRAMEKVRLQQEAEGANVGANAQNGRPSGVQNE